ncbi:MAG: quinol monooxygenase YgiN [Phenylobacterium sp.]|jgi:quinol monooxygenase YgiN
MGIIVIVGYKPKPGQEAALETLLKTHLPILQKEGLATDREAVLMKSKDGTLLEVFEWVSKEAIEQAHSNPQVQKMWQQYAQVCEYIPLSTLDETSDLFAEFAAIDGE